MPLPLYVPTLTLGQNLMDQWVIPYLTPDVTPSVMVSVPSITTASQGLLQKLKQALWVDSGSAVMLSSKTQTQWHQKDGVAVIEGTDHQKNVVKVHPQEVLTLQEEWADVAFTVDIPIQAKANDAKQRLEASIHNAIWTLENKARKDLLLFVSIPTINVESTVQTIKQLQQKGYLTVYGDRSPKNEQEKQENQIPHPKQFCGVALGGLIRRTKQVEFLTQLVSQVRAIYPGLIHLFGIGQPILCRTLFDAGATSVDSSSWIRYAVDGKLFDMGSDSVNSYPIQNPSNLERAHLALVNLAIAQQTTGLMREVPIPLMPYLNTWYLSRLAQVQSS